MSYPEELKITLDRASFFHVGRALHKGIGSSLLGDVTLSVCNGSLRIDSDWGGGVVTCTGECTVSVAVKAKAFCALVKTRTREREPAGQMEIVFRPSLKEIAIDRAGVKARFAA